MAGRWGSAIFVASQNVKLEFELGWHASCFEFDSPVMNRKDSVTAKQSSKLKEDENWALMGYYATNSGNFEPTFRDNLSIPSSGVMGPVCCPETSVPSSEFKGPRGHGTNVVPKRRSHLQVKGTRGHGTDSVPKRRSHLQWWRDPGVLGDIDCSKTSVPSSLVTAPRVHGTNRCPETSVPSSLVKAPKVHRTYRLSRNVGPIFIGQGTKVSRDR